MFKRVIRNFMASIRYHFDVRVIVLKCGILTYDKKGDLQIQLFQQVQNIGYEYIEIRGISFTLTSTDFRLAKSFSLNPGGFPK